MQIILLSGGSGTRLWPLSNDARSKQFLKVLPKEGDTSPESMIQRVVRQIREAHIEAPITVATGISQRDEVLTQLGEKVDIVTEPSRRHTFPAICLACQYLVKVKKCSLDEIVVVMPCDPYTGAGYYSTINKMADAVKNREYPLVLMGVKPTYPSAKYGYILPSPHKDGEDQAALPVSKFIEKPDVDEAVELIHEGALWNAGVFVFNLRFITEISDRYMNFEDFSEYRTNFAAYPEISFDREVVEKTLDSGVVLFDGYWKDLGTWNTLTDELNANEFGNVITDGCCVNTHIFNELNIPLLCMGVKDLIIAASPDGIIISEKARSENVKKYANRLKERPMYEERRWGSYKVIDYVEFSDNFHALTKQLTLKPGCSISYQRHNSRDEVWTFIDGEGEIVLDDVRAAVGRGDVIIIPKGKKHALKAVTSLTFIEVQRGSNLVEEDIERFPLNW